MLRQFLLGCALVAAINDTSYAELSPETLNNSNASGAYVVINNTHYSLTSMLSPNGGTVTTGTFSINSGLGGYRIGGVTKLDESHVNAAFPSIFLGLGSGAPTPVSPVGSLVLIGPGAGASITNCNGNVNPSGNAGFDIAIGSTALNADNGCENTAIGANSGAIITTGSFNIGLGNDTLANLTTGSDNIGIGHAAGSGAADNPNPLTGNSNVSVGDTAAAYLSGAAALNVYIGGSAGKGAVANPNTGSDNVVIGGLAGPNISSASDTVAIGFAALQGIVGAPNTGNANTAVGFHAGLAVQGAATSNTLIGNQAGAAITTGSSHTIIGNGAGNKITTNNNNTIIGAGVASTTLATGGQDILIGTTSAVDSPAANTNFMLNIGNVLAGVQNGGTSPRVCAVMMPCVLGVLKSADFNSVADQIIPIDFLTSTSQGKLSNATKYWITSIEVANCSASLTTAQGGIYTAASKGGTIIGATTTAFANCTSTTTRQRLTTLTNMDTTLLTAASLFLSLTTAQGGAATGDVYIMGTPVN